MKLKNLDLDRVETKEKQSNHRTSLFNGPYQNVHCFKNKQSKTIKTIKTTKTNKNKQTIEHMKL